MLDLKAKLAAAGLVTPAEVAAAERKSGPARGSNRNADRGPDQAVNRGSDRGSDRNADRGPDRNASRGPDRNASATAARPANPDRNANRGPDRNGPRQGQRPGPQSAERGKPAAPRSGLDIPGLQKAGKGAAYDALRRVIERARIDAALAIPSEQAEAFHFTTAGGQLSRLMLEPEARAQLGDGSAGITAFMSHHGLAHCVVPRVLAEDIARLFPFWLRVLKDHPGAGQQEPPPPPRPPRDPALLKAAGSDPTPAPDPTPETRDPESSDPEARDPGPAA